MSNLSLQDASAKSADTEVKTEFVQKPVYDFFKRAFDIVSSLAATIILIIPVLVIGAMIVIEDGWSPIYKHKRVGKHGKMINVYKFRSMKKNADRLEEMLTPEQLAEYKKEYKIVDDPRLIGYKKRGDGIKCFGAKLRRLSLDELPQIAVNILILGNMSVVGPRPILEDELARNYTPEEQKLLLSVKPGLTGYWQAYERNNVGYENGKRQKMELYYAQNRTFLFDMKIIVKTVFAVLKKSGAK